MGYEDEQITAILKLKDLKIWERAKKRLEETHRIEILKGNIIKIINWQKFQSEYRRQRPYRLQSKVTKQSYSKSDKEKREERREKRDIDNKNRYREFVFLTKEEHRKLIEDYGRSIISQYLERLNNYIGSKGRKYKSHYHTILIWLNKDRVSKQVKKELPKNKPDPAQREQVSRLVHETAGKMKGS